MEKVHFLFYYNLKSVISISARNYLSVAHTIYTLIVDTYEIEALWLVEKQYHTTLQFQSPCSPIADTKEIRIFWDAHGQGM